VTVVAGTTADVVGWTITMVVLDATGGTTVDVIIVIGSETTAGACVVETIVVTGFATTTGAWLVEGATAEEGATTIAVVVTTEAFVA